MEIRENTRRPSKKVRVSAYALGSVVVSEGGSYNLKIGYDDWARLWLNGKPIYRGRHDSGFEVDTVPVDLNQGRNDILLKLSNFDNFEWRLWAFNLRLEK